MGFVHAVGVLTPTPPTSGGRVQAPAGGMTVAVSYGGSEERSGTQT
jgi:hypothetical protein